MGHLIRPPDASWTVNNIAFRLLDLKFGMIKTSSLALDTDQQGIRIELTDGTVIRMRIAIDPTPAVPNPIS